MIAVKVRTIGPLKELFGTGELEVSLPAGADVDDLLASLTEAFGERCSPYFAPRKDAAALPHLRIMVNGRDIAVLGDRQATLGNDDEILMLTPVAGG
jgi:molybdopterin converting factor small subunit